MGRIRVLHVSQPVRGGVAAVVAQYAAAQVAAGWEVTVAFPAAQPEDREPGALAHAVTQAGAAVAHWSARCAPGRTVPAEAREPFAPRTSTGADPPPFIQGGAGRATGRSGAYSGSVSAAC